MNLNNRIKALEQQHTARHPIINAKEELRRRLLEMRNRAIALGLPEVDSGDWGQVLTRLEERVDDPIYQNLLAIFRRAYQRSQSGEKPKQSS